MGLILAIDQGTTGTTALLIDDSTFEFIAKSNQEFDQIYPSPGLVEHSLDDIWSTVEQSVTNVLSKAKRKASEISSIGITNQRETICSFNKDGDQLHNAIVWQDRRTETYCNNLFQNNNTENIKKITGLPIDPYFSASKINWLLNNSLDVTKAYSNNELLFGTIDTFLIYKLTAGNSYFTEASNASRTMLYDLIDGCWSDELCHLFGVSKECLPVIKDSFSDFGKTTNLTFLPDGIPITGVLGDQQSALFGQAGYTKGSLKCTYGTGAFILLNTGDVPFYSTNGLITTVAYREKGKNLYALEGSSYIAGAAVQWLRDNIGLFDSSPDIELLANKVENLNEMKNILFLPFFTGIGSPYWKSDATAAIVGLTRDTNKNHLSLACLDGICFSIEDLIRSLRNDSKLEIAELKVDGGAVDNNLLMEIQATISNLKIIKPQITETTAYGACLASAIGAGKIELDKISSLWKQNKVFEPNPKKKAHYNSKMKQWSKFIEKSYL